MEYIPTNALWEITHECNLRCLHCNTGHEKKYPDELVTYEALALCDDLAELGLHNITLTGGEPFLREDWHLIAERLTKNNIKTNIISNGWFIDSGIVKTAKESGIENICISIDGLEKTHDFMRIQGSFKRALSAIKIIAKNKMPVLACTSITKKNLPELHKLKSILYKNKIDRWQFRIAIPGTRFLKNNTLVIDPKDITKLIDFCYDILKEGQVNADISDDIGYFTVKETEIRNYSKQTGGTFFIWNGCEAGKRILGIRANGDISSCLSITDESFIEGNIRDVSLKEIWLRKDAFCRTRGIKKSQLTGFCSICQYGRYCFGGCTAAKLALTGSLSENRYCAFSLAIENERKKAAKIKDVRTLISTGRTLIQKNAYQVAEIYLFIAYTLESRNLEVIDLLGFVHFFLENYIQCKEFNEKALDIDPNHAYAFKGLGLCMTRMGEIEKGIRLLYHAIELADTSFTDPYYDLSVVLAENNRYAEALHVLGAGRNLSHQFKHQTESFYVSLITKLNRTQHSVESQ